MAKIYNEEFKKQLVKEYIQGKSYLPFQIMVADALFSKFFVKMPDKVYKMQGD